MPDLLRALLFALQFALSAVSLDRLRRFDAAIFQTGRCLSESIVLVRVDAALAFHVSQHGRTWMHTHAYICIHTCVRTRTQMSITIFFAFQLRSKRRAKQNSRALASSAVC